MSKSQFHSSNIPTKFKCSMNLSDMKTKDLIHLSNEELTSYVYAIQEKLQNKLDSGLSIDDIIDEEDPFEELEPILPQEVYPILVLNIINNIRSDTIMEAIIEGLQKGIKEYKNKIKE